MDTTSAPISLVLELSYDTEPVAGRLLADAHGPRAFVGYLELMSVLEEIRRSHRAQTPRTDTPATGSGRGA